MITAATLIEGPLQADGRRYVQEKHTSVEGKVYEFSYLADGDMDVQAIMAARRQKLTEQLAAEDVAKTLAAETTLPLSHYAFLLRFTLQERIAVRALAKTDPVVEDFLDLLRSADYVTLSHARPGLEYLVQAGVLTASRAAQIGAD